MSVLHKIGPIVFPPSSFLNINMMPFVMHDPDSLPGEYQSYWPLIEACQIEAAEHGRVGYLSIQESDVPAGLSQRRPDIHTEGHGRGRAGWGGGSLTTGEHRQGLYQANSIHGSCRAWDIPIDDPGPMGSCDEERVVNHTPRYLEANTLYWMADNCPHESLPLTRRQRRQWFRVVTSAVDLWYAQHSTRNRLGVMPNCRIVRGNKFTGLC